MRLRSRLVNWIIQSVALFRRGMTLGVRVAATQNGERVVLVRHQYLPGWYLPGGGVDPGETLAQAAQRELAEETGYGCVWEPKLVSMHYNTAGTGRDHVGFYQVELGAQDAAWRRPSAEIAEVRLFELDALPEDISPATARRLEQLRSGAAAAPHW